MLDQENCIALLRVLAEKLSSHSDGDVPGIFAQVLGADPNTMAFHRRLVALEDLGRRARQQLDEIADDPSYDLYVEAIDRIVATFEQLNMRENWINYRSPFNPHTMALLQTCKRAVGHRLSATALNEAAIGEALAEVQEAMSGILHADIDAEAKQLLLEILGEAEGVLLAYQISGLAGLRRAVEHMFGAMIVNWPVIRKYEEHSVMKRVWKVFVTLVNAAQKAYFLNQITGARDFFIKMLNP
jgi:hypothetical protein